MFPLGSVLDCPVSPAMSLRSACPSSHPFAPGFDAPPRHVMSALPDFFAQTPLPVLRLSRALHPRVPLASVLIGSRRRGGPLASVFFRARRLRGALLPPTALREFVFKEYLLPIY